MPRCHALLLLFGVVRTSSLSIATLYPAASPLTMPVVNVDNSSEKFAAAMGMRASALAGTCASAPHADTAAHGWHSVTKCGLRPPPRGGLPSYTAPAAKAAAALTAALTAGGAARGVPVVEWS